MWSRCIAQWNWSRLPECEVDAKASVELLRKTNDAWGLADALSWASWPLIWNGKVEEGVALATEGEELCVRVGHIGTQALCLRARTLGESILEPDLDVMESAAALENAMLTSVNSPWVALSEAWMATLDEWRGRFDEALAHAARCEELMPQSAWSGLGDAARLTVLAWAGKSEECAALLRSGTYDPPAEGAVASAGHHFKFQAAMTAIGLTGDTELAEQWYDAAAREVSVYRYGGFDLSVSERLTGMVALTAGRLDDAARHLTEADRIAREDPNRLDAPHVDYWLARLHLAQGDNEEARRRATAARDEFARLGAPPFEAAAAELLARLS
jgi:tetratricopeptide (TPR) repeat protein